jgi:staphylococcal nuclease domain-containing protein 1
MILLAGIRAPSTKRTNTSDGKEQPAEPFGEEAQQFVETRLLQRTAAISVLGLTPNGQIVADVKHPTQGSITPFLLQSGLAKCTDHHTTLLGQRMGALRQAEKVARDTRQGLYQGHVAPSSRAANEMEATVSRVQSADTLFIRNKAGAEKRINLSSVRQPKPTDPKQSPWVAEAKEFLRKKLIGKHVKFSIDGKRPGSEGYDEREMATVTFQGKNIGLILVESGMATVIRHRQDDTDRSPIYDDLLLAEATAQEEQRGLWSPKTPSTKQYVDYSESLEKAKRQLTLLSRQRRVPAVVDFVKSASRFTVLIPRENAKITLVLSGIRAPRSARNESDQGEPFGKEAHEFANRRCQQRDVEIDVEDCDKVGGFIGTLYFPAEQRAKDARKGLWHEYDPSQDEEAEYTAPTTETSNGDAAVSRRKDYRDVIVTHVDETGRLKLQQVGTGTAALTELMNAFGKFHLNPTNNQGLPNPPKAGDFVAARFTADDQWYRARIRRNDREAKKAEVVYIDFGNSETIPWSRLRPLSQSQFLPSALKPQAIDAQLSFIQLPGNPEYLEDAVDQVEKDGMLWVTLFDPKESKTGEDSVNADVIMEGLAMVPKKLKTWERSASDVLGALTKKMNVAKEERRGQWEYGDLTED